MKTKELVIISGKGGTGKTSIVSSFATLAKNKIMVDCDVDAADLHLILKPEIIKTTEFFSGKKAEILKEKCIQCGRCIEVCRFDAISTDFIVDEIGCEGCGTCYFQCPAEAIKFEKTKSGDWFESDTRFGKLIHAKLGIAEENSGKLVSEIRNYARLLAHREGQDLIIVDGSPGIGCPVIASISGASLVVVVTEPTLSGLHDAERVLKLAKHFNAPACMCINKFDINPDMANKIEEFCKKENIEIVGKIPYSKDFTDAMIKEESLIEFSPEGEISKEIKLMWEKLEEKLKEKQMKIAIPTANGKLCQHFGHCEKFIFIEVDEATKTIIKNEAIVGPEHAPGILPPWVAEQGATLILAGGMGGHAQALFAQQGIKVLAGCPSEDPEKIVKDYLNGTLVQGENGCDHSHCANH